MVDVLLGLQWGDEGKGKIVDVLSPGYEIIARFQGGPNAGHTLVIGKEVCILNLIPSGIFRDDVINIIGNGVVLDPITLKKEVERLEKIGLDVKSKLRISKKTSLILPSHKFLDAAQEASKGEDKIGTTLRGISPTYQDKIGRNGLRVGDILSRDFDAKYEALVAKHKPILDYLKYEGDFEQAKIEFMEAILFLKNLQLIDSEIFIQSNIKNGKKILAEGAQGSLLDIDFGSFPYVTSSNTTSAAVCTGLGVNPKQIGEVFGIFKAYCTRVGNGPFPTELDDKTGEELRSIGQEFGATTGRPRRCGWLDLPALKYAIMLSGVTQLIMTKVDVLNSFKTIKVCTHYKTKEGELIDYMPYDIEESLAEPIYDELPGWKSDLTDIKNLQDLPKALQDYIAYIEKAVELPVNYISVGPERGQMLRK